MTKTKRRNQVTCRCSRYSFPHRQTEDCLRELYPRELPYDPPGFFSEEEFENSLVARGIHYLARRRPTEH